MMKIMNVRFNIVNYKNLLAIIVIFLLGACESMLDTFPEDSKIREEYWKMQDDVESAVIGSYNSVQDCVLKFFVWGELRGELVKVSIDPGGLEDINEHLLNEHNWYCRWHEIYSAINKVNTVLKFAPSAQENDDTFSEEELDEYIGECLTLRALLYFYLARTFLEFPYIANPSDNDEQEFSIPPSSGDQVLDSIISDLLKAEDIVRTDFNDLTFENEAIKLAYEKGRVTKSVVWAILTDVYLTKGEYENAVKYADSLISDTRFQLVGGSQWMLNFFPGNSSESIFELQFSKTYYDEGKLASWFTTDFGDDNILFTNRRNRNTRTYKYWEGDDFANPSLKDFRGPNGTFSAENKEIIWKWAGKERSGGSTYARDLFSNDANWIFYRLADIILMKAEALNRMQQHDQAIELLLEIRERAGYTNETIETGSENALEELILDERAREFAAEGKRWFDLARIAKRQDNYEIIANRIADAMAYPSEQGIWKARVFKPLSWYFPIHRDELDLNRMLKQNPYYEEK
jgi:hypothetical protein